MKKIRSFVESAKAGGLYPPMLVTEGLSSEPEVVVEGHRVISFASANYLGLANDARVKQAVIDGINRYGLHPCGSRCVSGSLDVHRALERQTARFKGCDDALLFPTGMMANMGTIPAVVDMPLRGVAAVLRQGADRRKNVIFSDELNHASIIDGYSLARAEVVSYRHNDCADLEEKMHQYRDHRALIVTDGVFSMDGDVGALPGLCEVADEFGAIMMVDDAHASGVFGHAGRGTVDHFQLQGRVDVQVGTLSKAIGVLGGYVAGSRALIEFLHHRARPFLFSTSHPPAVAAACLAALDVLEAEPGLIERLWENTRFFKGGLDALGFNTGISESPITPVIVGEGALAMKLSDRLFEEGVFAQGIGFPTVARDKARVRTIVTATHTRGELQFALDAFARVGRELGIR